MGRALWIWAAFLTAIVGVAAARTSLLDEAGSTTPLPKAAGQKFAGELHAFILEVQLQYVREISEIDLIVAAMAALHASASKTPPRDLADQLLALKKDPPTYQSKCVALIAQLRVELGDRPEWRDQKDVVACVNGLSRVLDPHCGFAETREFTLERDGEFGTGIEFHNVLRPTSIEQGNGQSPAPRIAQPGKVPDRLLVKQVVPGGPSQQAGLRPGDIVIKIDGRPCQELNWAQIYATFFPDAVEDSNQSTVRAHRLEVRRPGLEMTRIVELPPGRRFFPETLFGVARDAAGRWNYVIAPAERLCYARVGPLNLIPFGNGGAWTTANELQALLHTMKQDGHAGLLLDLRWCPGGYLTTAQAVARSFVDHDEPIGKIRYRFNSSTTNDEDQIVKRFPEIPLLVLVNSETSGGGELIAAALQDYGRAVIAGERTRGKATIQRPLNPNSLSMKYQISIGEFLSPKSRKLQRFATDGPNDDWGVRPDEGRWLPLSSEVGSQLKEWWTWHALRPTGSLDALPTDDLDADPQLKAAVQMLRQITTKAKS